MSSDDASSPHSSFPAREHAIRQNRQVYDSMAMRSEPLCRTATPQEMSNPLPIVDAIGWLGRSIQGWDVLCLAAGGGRQSCLYASAGAKVTVVDISPAMLEQDRRMAAEHGFSVRLLETSMDDLSALEDGAFDLVAHPVSTCYLPVLHGLFAEVSRVLRPGGLYVSQHKSPTSLQTSADRGNSQCFEIRHRYYRDTPIPSPSEQTPNSKRLRETGATEYLHRWEQLVGGMCRAGFVIEDLVEPVHNDPQKRRADFADRANYVAPYVRIKARKHSGKQATAGRRSSRPELWIPGT